MVTARHDMTDRGDGVRLASARTAGRAPTVVFLPGLGSDMDGIKATTLAAALAARGQAVLRLDYSGHGRSEGRLVDGTVGRWRDDALALVDRLTTGPLLLFGSSMGGWIALLIARLRPDRVVGVVAVAAAPDFTRRQVWAALDAPTRARIVRDGMATVALPHGTVTVTRALIEDGDAHALLADPSPVAVRVPVRLVHGQDDATIPWRTALALADRLAGTDVRVTLVKDGDHRLSRKPDLVLLRDVLFALLDTALGGEHGA